MHPHTLLDRRGFLGDSATLLGSTALATLLSGEATPAAETPITPISSFSQVANDSMVLR